MTSTPEYRIKDANCRYVVVKEIWSMSIAVPSAGQNVNKTSDVLRSLRYDKHVLPSCLISCQGGCSKSTYSYEYLTCFSNRQTVIDNSQKAYQRYPKLKKCYKLMPYANVNGTKRSSWIDSKCLNIFHIRSAPAFRHSATASWSCFPVPLREVKEALMGWYLHRRDSTSIKCAKRTHYINIYK